MSYIQDITQQSLCEPGSVDLVEKCARFHVHCTARLCELSMQDFDQVCLTRFFFIIIFFLKRRDLNVLFFIAEN